MGVRSLSNGATPHGRTTPSTLDKGRATDSRYRTRVPSHTRILPRLSCQSIPLMDLFLRSPPPQRRPDHHIVQRLPTKTTDGSALIKVHQLPAVPRPATAPQQRANPIYQNYYLLLPGPYHVVPFCSLPRRNRSATRCVQHGSSSTALSQADRTRDTSATGSVRLVEATCGNRRALHLCTWPHFQE